jgi:hypothetical protein
VLEQCREEANVSSQHRANLTIPYSSGAMQKWQSCNIARDDIHRISRNLEVDFIDIDILPKTRDTMIMATAAYITDDPQV